MSSSLNFIWILESHLGMYDEPPTNKQGIQTNAELFVIQNIVVNLPAISGDWSIEKMSNIKKKSSITVIFKWSI